MKFISHFKILKTASILILSLPTLMSGKDLVEYETGCQVLTTSDVELVAGYLGAAEFVSADEYTAFTDDLFDRLPEDISSDALFTSADRAYLLAAVRELGVELENNLNLEGVGNDCSFLEYYYEEVAAFAAPPPRATPRLTPRRIKKFPKGTEPTKRQEAKREALKKYHKAGDDVHDDLLRDCSFMREGEINDRFKRKIIEKKTEYLDRLRKIRKEFGPDGNPIRKYSATIEGASN